MVIVGFEGMGGSGKSTLIGLVNRISPVRSVYECRDEPPAGCDPDRWYLEETLRTFDTYATTGDLYLFDRSFIATLGVTYAKMRLGIITPERHQELLDVVGDRRLDGLVLCLAPTETVLQRRNKRDGNTHPLWGDPVMMAQFDAFIRTEAPKYAHHTRVMNTGETLTDEEIGRLHGWIHALPRRE